MTTRNISQLSDDELVARILQAASDERGATVSLLRLLLEVDQRRLYLQRGHPSLFAFCTSVLRLSEQAAYARITASRTARRFPALLDGLENGDLTLSSIGRLAPHLSDENVDALLESARGRTTREVERLVASLYPEPAIPTTIRALPARSPAIETRYTTPPTAMLLADTPHTATTPTTPTRLGPITPRRDNVAPVGPRFYSLRVTINQDTHQKLDRLRSLMRHTIPDGDVGVIIDRAITLLLDHVERQKCATLKRPAQNRDGRPSAIRGADRGSISSRGIPAAVRRTVWQRDDGRCAFVGTDGRCGARDFLEFHHVVPFAMGGPATIDNIQLRCRAHNAHEATLCFGAGAADSRRAADKPV